LRDLLYRHFDLEEFQSQHKYLPILNVVLYQKRKLRMARYLAECDISVEPALKSYGRVKVSTQCWFDMKLQTQVEGSLALSIRYESQAKIMQRMSRIQEEKLSVMMHFNMLSNEEIFTIFSYLNLFELIRIGPVSKLWSCISRSPLLWIDRSLEEVEHMTEAITKHFIKKRLPVQSIDRFATADPEEMMALMNGERESMKVTSDFRFRTAVRFPVFSYVLGFHFACTPNPLSISLVFEGIDNNEFSNFHRDLWKSEISKHKGQVPIIFAAKWLKMSGSIENNKDVTLSEMSFHGTTEDDLEALAQIPTVVSCVLSGGTISDSTLAMLQNMFLIIQTRKCYPGVDPFPIADIHVNRIWNRMIELVDYALSNNIFLPMVSHRTLNVVLTVVHYLLIQKRKSIARLGDLIKLLKNPDMCWYIDEDTVETLFEILEDAINMKAQKILLGSGILSLLRRLLKLPMEHIQHKTLRFLEMLSTSHEDILLNSLTILSTSVHASSINRVLDSLLELKLSDEDLFDLDVIKNCIRVSGVPKCHAIDYIDHNLQNSPDPYQFVVKLLNIALDSKYDHNLLTIASRLSSSFISKHLIKMLKKVTEELTVVQSTSKQKLLDFILQCLGNCGEDTIDLVVEEFNQMEEEYGQTNIFIISFHKVVVRTIFNILKQSPHLSTCVRRELLLKFLFITSHNYEDDGAVTDCLQTLLDNKNAEITLSIGSMLYNLSSKVEQQENELHNLNDKLIEQSTELESIRRMIAAVMNSRDKPAATA
jgi:uncharacterized coiled-coil protein SlyX